ncbi:peptidylprolyl isomerase [Balneolales bacterium ANBcel1]|nr:peptidylprolyl isomerase [Balneolales bacterium ANBcel1]
MNKAVLFVMLALMGAAVASCGNSEELERLQRVNADLRSQNRELQQRINVINQEMEEHKAAEERMAFLADQMKDVKARIHTNHGEIELEFLSNLAPIHVFNFVTRAESGFYNGTKFHRVIPGFMIQGGDPNTRGDDRRTYGSGGPLISIPHEFNRITHEPGVLSMARVSDVSAGAGSQFFIMHGNNPSLDNQYTAFGRVTRGMDVVNSIAQTDISREYRDQPVEDVIIERIEVYR